MKSSDPDTQMSDESRRHADTVITGVDVLLPGSDVLRDGAVAIADGLIMAVDSAAAIDAGFASDSVVSGPGIVSPGLIDAHTHLALSFARALREMKGHPVYDVFWPLELRIDAELVGAFARTSIAEALLAGVTTVADHYFYADATVEAVRELGIRGVIGQTIIRHDGPHHSEQSLGDGIDFAERHRSVPLVHPALAPHALDTVGDDWIVAVAGSARAMDVPVHMHVAQSQREWDAIRHRSGRSPIAQLDELGVLDQRTVAAHCMYADDADHAILASKPLVHPIYCPTVHAALGKVMAAAKMYRMGSPIGIGTDAAPSERFDVLGEAQAASAHQAVLGESLSVEATFLAATEGNAHALGLGEITGKIELGYAADLVLWRTDRAVAGGAGDPRRLVAAVCGPDLVESVWVAGRRVVSGGRLTTGDESTIGAAADAARVTLFDRAGL